LCQIKKVYPLQEYVNFGYGISSKIPEVLCKVEMKILTHLPFYKTEDLPLLEQFITDFLLFIANQIK
jgi:hypothetical protein